MNKLSFTAAIVFLLLFSGCERYQHIQAKTDFYGKWQWMVSTGGIAGSTYTPENCSNCSHRVEITTDGIFYKISSLGDTLINIPYSLKRNGCEPGKFFLDLGSGYADYCIWLEEGYLLMNDNMSDGYLSEYYSYPELH